MSRTLSLLTWIAIGFASGGPISTAAAQTAAKNGGGSVYVITHVDVTPNYAEPGTKLLQQFAMESRKDPGVVRFEVLKQDSRGNHFTVVEVWQTQQAFDAHSSAAHTKAFREKLGPMLGSPYDERVHSIVQ
jgi:quinol monooxygenase YgiN